MLNSHEAELDLKKSDRIRKKRGYSVAAEERSIEVLRNKLANDKWDDFVGLEE